MMLKKGLALQLFLSFMAVELMCNFLDASISENDDHHRDKRETGNFHGPYWGKQNRTFSYFKVLLVVDNKIYNNYLENNITKVNQRYKNIMDIVNLNFQEYTRNLYVTLTDIVIWTDSDKIVLNGDIQITLNQFKEYVRKTYANNPMIDVNQVILMGGISFQRVNWYVQELNQSCELSFGVIQDTQRPEDNVAKDMIKVLTREMNIEKAFADCSSTTSSESVWNSCKRRFLPQINEKIEKLACFNNKPAKVLNTAVCGNGFIEGGEQCDCGPIEECDNPCCNATICMFKAKALCAMGDCCDLKTCKIRAVSTTCRPKSEDCDLPEYCDGRSEFCPDDVFKIIGESCTEGSKCDVEKHKCRGKAIQCEEIHCNNNGFCNSRGHCHCNDGFAPPACESPGFGGSVDSGPPPDVSFVDATNGVNWITAFEIVGTMLPMIVVGYAMFKLFPLVLKRYELHRNLHNFVDNPTCTVQSSSTVCSPESAAAMQYNKSGDVIFVPVFVPPPPSRKDCM